MKYLKNIAPQPELYNIFIRSRLARGVFLGDKIMKVGAIARAKEIGKNDRCLHILCQCPICEKKRWTPIHKTKNQNYTGLCKDCYGKSNVGKKNGMWKGGKSPSRDYIRVAAPKHPLSTKDGYILEHRLVAANEWGVEAVRDMHVHHKDGNKSNNSLGNLEVMTHADHMKCHAIKKRQDRA